MYAGRWQTGLPAAHPRSGADLPVVRSARREDTWNGCNDIGDIALATPPPRSYAAAICIAAADTEMN